MTDLAHIRNFAIIAHIDHGKSTLADRLIQLCGGLAEREMKEQVLDSMELERERGITILAKNTAINWKEWRINIVDTPGHADFGGEVERVVSMADGALVLVDAAEGPMPQTRYVLSKALACRLKPIVVVNKIDRPEHRAEEILDEVFDLLLELGADDNQLDFPVVYSSAKAGIATLNMSEQPVDLSPLMQAIVEHTPAPVVDSEGPLQFQAVTFGYDA